MKKSIKTIGIYVVGLICVVALLFLTQVLKNEEFEPYTTISANNEEEIRSKILGYLKTIGDFNNDNCKEVVSLLNQSKDDISHEAFDELKALIRDSVAISAENYIYRILNKDNLEYDSLSRCDGNALVVLMKAGWSNTTIEDCHEIVQLLGRIKKLYDYYSYEVDTDNDIVKFNNSSFKYKRKGDKIKFRDEATVKKNIRQMIDAIESDSCFERIKDYDCVKNRLNVENIYKRIIEII